MTKPTPNRKSVVRNAKAIALALALAFTFGCSEKCGEAKYDPEKQFCSEDKVYEKCGGEQFNPDRKICIDGKVTTKCGDKGYDTETQFCSGDKIYEKCGGEAYDVASKICIDGKVVAKCGGKEYNSETHFCDTRDYRLYKYVKIGEQVWFADNLNYAGKYKDIGICKVNDICESLGRLYLWRESKTVCPDGWHLPSENDWLALINYAGENVAGKKLKAKQGWDGKGNGTDDFGFSALAAGAGRDIKGFTYRHAGKVGYWWSSNYSVGSGFFRMIYEKGYPYPNSDHDVNKVHNSYISGGDYYSVRCIRDYLCNGKKFDTSKQFCANNDVHNKCGDEEYSKEYNPVTHFCSTTGITEKCGGKEYDTETHVCFNDKVESKDKYGICEDDITEDKPYNLQTHFCYGYGRYVEAGGVEVFEKCGGKEYDVATHFCEGGNIKKYECNGKEYDKFSEFCFKGELYRLCGYPIGIEYNPETHNCVCGNSDCGVEKK